MATIQTKIIYDKDTKCAYEYIKLVYSRQKMRDFMSKGSIKLQKTINGTTAYLSTPNNNVLNAIMSEMTIGDNFEGRRVADITAEKCVIDHLGKKVNTIVFVYKF